jgi:hypothetical protein
MKWLGAREIFPGHAPNYLFPPTILHLPIMPHVMNLSVDLSTDEVRSLRIQSLLSNWIYQLGTKPSISESFGGTFHI